VIWPGTVLDKKDSGRFRCPKYLHYPPKRPRAIEKHHHNRSSW
jgi:hypothetical protein